MNGVVIVFVAIILGTLVGMLDLFSGLAILIVGGLIGLVVTWMELS